MERRSVKADWPWVLLALTAMFFVGLYAAPKEQHPAEVAPSPEMSAWAGARSGKWGGVQAAHLKKEPLCAVCGTSVDLNVHHIVPFHIAPERELDPDNLITLCGPKGHSCHLHFGHLFNYKSYNAHVRKDAEIWAAKVRARP